MTRLDDNSLQAHWQVVVINRGKQKPLLTVVFVRGHVRSVYIPSGFITRTDGV